MELQKKKDIFLEKNEHQTWLNPPVMAADRVMDMLLKKVKGEEFVTELPIPEQDLVPIAPAIKDLSKVKNRLGHYRRNCTGR